MAKAVKKPKRKPKPTELTSLDQLKPAPYNPRAISEPAMGGLTRSLEEFGDISGITWNRRTGHLVTGHQRLEAIKKRYGAGVTLETVRRGDKVTQLEILADSVTRFPVRVVDWPEATEKAANLAANNPLIAGDFTDELAELVKGIDAELAGALRLPELLDEYGLKEIEPTGDPQTLVERFGVPPFSVLDARQGYWQDRKRAWLALGIQSEIGRGARPHGKDDRPVGESGQGDYRGGDCWKGSKRKHGTRKG